MNYQEYSRFVMEKFVMSDAKDGIFHALVGIMKETGEMLFAIEQSKPEKELIKELGDVLFYIVALRGVLGKDNLSEPYNKFFLQEVINIQPYHQIHDFAINVLKEIPLLAEYISKFQWNVYSNDYSLKKAWEEKVLEQSEIVLSMLFQVISCVCTIQYVAIKNMEKLKKRHGDGKAIDFSYQNRGE